MALQAICYTCEIDWAAVRRPVETEIERALARARRLNRLNGVTGAILLYPDRLVQWLVAARRWDQPLKTRNSFCPISWP